MKDLFHHLLGRGLPLLLLFLLPVFGGSTGVTFTLFLVLMFGAHLLMRGGQGERGDGAERAGETSVGSRLDERRKT